MHNHQCDLSVSVNGGTVTVSISLQFFAFHLGLGNFGRQAASQKHVITGATASFFRLPTDHAREASVLPPFHLCPA